MMLVIREPRTFLWPFPNAAGAGDVIEAVLGLCVPWQDAHLEFRQRFAAAWGLKLDDFVDRHGEIEDAFLQVSGLVMNVHHHDAAKKAGCPQTWRDMERADFKLKAPMLVLEEIVPAASLASLATY
eukprot:7765633-Pyramimonas_sp.AAC.1